MATRAARLLVRKVAARTRAHLLRRAPEVVRLIERQLYPMPRDRKAEERAFAELGLELLRRKRIELERARERCRGVKAGIKLADVAANPTRQTVLTAARAAADACLVAQQTEREQARAAVVELRAALAED